MNIVLVHGAWADGSCWSAVIERLQADGYNVTAPQFPMTQLSADVARLRQVLARQNGPTIVAGGRPGRGSSNGGPDQSQGGGAEELRRVFKTTIQRSNRRQSWNAVPANGHDLASRRRTGHRGWLR